MEYGRTRGVGDNDDHLDEEVAGALRAVRHRSRVDASSTAEPARYPFPRDEQKRLDSIHPDSAPAAGASPDRRRLNELWEVSGDSSSAPASRLGRLFSPLRGPLRRIGKFVMGPVVDRQVEFNSAQVQFNNELVGYFDRRLDRISTHYDNTLALYGRRMEEIDERHLILQQELIRHVHELVKRIDFVFETAEQNHLYLEGVLREVQDELRSMVRRLEQHVPSIKG